MPAFAGSSRSFPIAPKSLGCARLLKLVGPAGLEPATKPL